MEKIKVNLSYLTYSTIINDAEAFQIYKSNGEINKNEIFNRIVANLSDDEFNKKIEKKNKYKDILSNYINTEKDIIYQAQMGTLEFHTWGSKIDSINKPDLMVFDLDPAPNVDIDKLRQGVLLLKGVLDKLKLKSYLKTSGGKGYHIVVPFSKSKNWKTFKEFSNNIAKLCEKLYPDMFTTSIRKKDRNGKIFVDYLRNEKGSTCVCAYSLRARKNAPVSVPISWQSLSKIAPNKLTIKDTIKYATTHNPWKDIYEIKQELVK